MNLISKKPLSMAEVKSYLPEREDRKPIDDYIKKFVSLGKDKATKMTEEIKSLNNPKIKEENVAKIVDLLPEDFEDINKIFTEVSLTEDEANAILQIVKKH